ncbi:competence protein ComE [Alkalihalobacillus alcalophilus ATCC 27647 = CGMCC 1.3604]|nr:helix-hairpin-helix domain-containing protein [Alkalihalobacillus alcalophilus]KGA98466.1 competence protein ComEA [Alkalihalobacillus alcalophilus ATCC 27647 = CGMCC 1.3604]MED1563348.1 helix-hairpin-helix domain-containing protein [Alkalihalobacillus alcalophilus]THG88535.1 competence protein ComE [Alkalihalobacillus alcalophilus ATCC 27647 = CGMCC 1.3604]
MKKLSLREWLVLIASSLMVLFSLGLFAFVFNRDKSTTTVEQSEWAFLEGQDEEETTEEESSVEEMELVVDIKGAIKRPGIYVMEEGERIHDVINKAGGLIDEADDLQVNLASLVTDEMVIYIPSIHDEEAYSGPLQVSATSEADGLINLNTATQAELEQLPGVGPSKAAQIIAYREEHGSFVDIEDLKKVSGFGEKSFEQLKALIITK